MIVMEIGFRSSFLCVKEYIGIKLIIDDIIKNRNHKLCPLNHIVQKIHKIFINSNLFNNSNVKIFSKQEMNNQRIYGFHLKTSMVTADITFLF